MESAPSAATLKTPCEFYYAPRVRCALWVRINNGTSLRGASSDEVEDTPGCAPARADITNLILTGEQEN